MCIYINTNLARNIVSKVKPSTLSKMKISNLLFLGCFFCVSVYDARGNVKIITEEFNTHFKEYVSHKASNLTFFNILKQKNDVCQCAIEQLQKIQDGFHEQNSTEVAMMKKNLQALIDLLMKSGKSKDQAKHPGKQEECKFMLRDPNYVARKISYFFSDLNKRRCFRGSR